MLFLNQVASLYSYHCRGMRFRCRGPSITPQNTWPVLPVRVLLSHVLYRLFVLSTSRIIVYTLYPVSSASRRAYSEGFDRDVSSSVLNLKSWPLAVYPSSNIRCYICRRDLFQLDCYHFSHFTLLHPNIRASKNSLHVFRSGLRLLYAHFTRSRA